MGKLKDRTSTIPNKHLHSRINYLYQAALLLDNVQKQSKSEKTHNLQREDNAEDLTTLGPGSSRQMVDHLQRVALKARIRLAPSMKHSVCKRCQSIQSEGTTLKTFIENRSKGRKKPWADVLVHECVKCGTLKRFPIGAKQQQRRQNRPTRTIDREPSSRSDQLNEADHVDAPEAR